MKKELDPTRDDLLAHYKTKLLVTINSIEETKAQIELCHANAHLMKFNHGVKHFNQFVEALYMLLKNKRVYEGHLTEQIIYLS